MNTTVTRRTTVGFGYTSAVENDERGNLRVETTTAPDHTGTILQVEKAIESDRTLASFRSGTYYSTAWFIKINGEWRKVKNTDENNYNLRDLTAKVPTYGYGRDTMKYAADAVNIEVE